MLKSFPFLFFFICTTTTAIAGGSVQGKISYRGGEVKSKTISVSVDSEVCGKTKLKESLIVSRKGDVKNAVVHIRGPVEGGALLSQLGKDFVIDQKGCVFKPRLLIAPVGSPIKILNSDGILHSFHTLSKINPPIHRAQAANSSPIMLQLNRAEIFKYQCNIHSWMDGWIVVADNSYYSITTIAGEYRLTDIPAGSYTLQVWHETLGKQEKLIDVKERETTVVNFRYGTK